MVVVVVVGVGGAAVVVVGALRVDVLGWWVVTVVAVGAAAVVVAEALRVDVFTSARPMGLAPHPVRILALTLSCQPPTASPHLNPGPDISGCRTAALPHPTPIGPTTPHGRHRSGQVLPFRRRSNFACIRRRGVGETTNQSLQG